MKLEAENYFELLTGYRLGPSWEQNIADLLVALELFIFVRGRQ